MRRQSSPDSWVGNWIQPHSRTASMSEWDMKCCAAMISPPPPNFSCGLRAMAARAGRPEALHQTTTIAFLSLIAERLALRDAPADFTAFERANPDLMDKSVLAHWYRPERLALAAARRTFLLP
jgi:hypothetical protein